MLIIVSSPLTPKWCLVGTWPTLGRHAEESVKFGCGCSELKSQDPMLLSYASLSNYLNPNDHQFPHVRWD